MNTNSQEKNDVDSIFIGNIESFKHNIDKLLIKYLPIEDNVYHSQVIEALRYSFEVGGKRIRPMLMYGAYQLLVPQSKTFYTIEVLESFMAAIEMIHTYSLIHDDLPAMDNDDMRRGKPTCHIQYGEANAILAGDGLLNYAFEVVLQQGMSVSPELAPRFMRALYELSESSGVYGMIGGQAADMYFESTELTHKEQLDYIHQHKTGAIITSALLIGGILAGADESEIEQLRLIGHEIGLSFQIQDDILDCTSTEAVLGKPIGSDQKNSKKTYVSFVGIEQSKIDIDNLLTSAKNRVTALHKSPPPATATQPQPQAQSLLLELIDFLSTRTY